MTETNETSGITYRRILLHQHTDLDATVALVLAQRFEQMGFLGLGDAKVSFHGQLPMSLAEMKEAGAIAFDFGWQSLTEEERNDPEVDLYVIDHHGKHPDKSTTYLVAEKLGLLGDPAYQSLVNYVDMQDLEGPHAVSSTLLELGRIPPEIVERARSLERFSWAGLFGALRKTARDQGLLKFVDRIVNRFIDGQLRFWRDVAGEYERKVQILELGNGGRKLRIAIIGTDMTGMAAFSRTRKGGSCAAIVQRQSNGNTQILANQWMRPHIDLGELAKILRVSEMRERGTEDAYKPSILAQDGKLDICPWWYIVRNPKTQAVWMVANASLKHDVEPTVLPLELIRDAVAWGLDERVLSPQCPGTHCLSRDCDFYPFGLRRCDRIRRAAMAKAA